MCISELVVVNILKREHTMSTRTLCTDTAIKRNMTFQCKIHKGVKKQVLCLIVVFVFVVIFLIIRCQRSSNVNPSVLLMDYSF